MRHLLSAMLAAVVCATLCGFRGLQPTLIWLTTHGPAMWHLLGVRRRPPVSQTSGNVLAELDPEFLESLLRSFGEQCVPGEVPPTASPKALSNHAVPNTAMPPDVEIGDGKTLHGTRQPDARAASIFVRLDQALGKIVSRHAAPASGSVISR